MGLEQNNEQHYREVPDKYAAPVADYQMTTRDYVMRPDSSDILGDLTITLPSVVEAKGRWYSIIARDADMTHNIVIQDKDDSEQWEGDIRLTETGGGQLFYSDGLKWMGRTFADIEIEASARGSYTQAAGISGEIVAGRFRSEGHKADTGSGPACYGVHAQGIAYADLFTATINAAYCEAIAKDGASVETIMRGLMVAADSEGTPTLIQSMYGAHIRVKTSVQPTGAYRCLVLEHEKFGAGTLLDEYIKILDTTFTGANTVATYGLRMLTTGIITNGISLESPMVTGIMIGAGDITGNALLFGVSGENTGGGLIKAGTSAARIVQDVANMKFMSFYLDNGATSGDNRGMYLRQYLTGAGGGGEAVRIFSTVEDVACGTVHGAHISLNFGATGTVTGLGVAMRATLHIANQGTQAGTMAAIQAELWSDGAASDPSGSLLSFLRIVNGGDATGVVDVDDDAALFDLVGFASGAAKMWYDHQGGAPVNVEEWVKVRTPSGTRWLALYNAVV